MSVTRRSASVIVLAALGLGSAIAPALAQADKPFRIGVVLSRSGVYSQFGTLLEAALTVGVKDANDQGGILGRKVELVIRDSNSNPSRSLLAAKELVEEQKVDYLIPETISGNTLAILPYTTDKKMVTISTAGAPQVGDIEKYPYSFPLVDLATKRVPAMAAALKKLGGKKVGVLVGTNPVTVTIGDGLKNNQAKLGIEVVDYKQFAADVKDLSAQLQGLRDAGADIVAFAGSAKDNLRVVMAGMQTIGWKAKVVGDPVTLNGDPTEQIPAAVQDQFFDVHYRVVVKTADPSPDRQKFVDELKKQGEIQNLGVSALFRDSILLAKWMFETSQKERGNIDNESLKATLESLNGRDYPKSYGLLLGNPKYSPKDHSSENADYSKMWGLVKVSKPVDGIYEGEALDVAY